MAITFKNIFLPCIFVQISLDLNIRSIVFILIADDSNITSCICVPIALDTHRSPFLVLVAIATNRDICPGNIILIAFNSNVKASSCILNSIDANGLVKWWWALLSWGGAKEDS